MRRRVRVALSLGVAFLAGWIITSGVQSRDQTPKRGGTLTSLIIEDPPGFLIHEAATTSVLWPMMPCYSNLVLFDQLKARETLETVVPELAERWSWQDNYRNLVFFLKKNVKWHDGRPFTSKDVKYTFDVVREAKDAPAKLRLSPRKEWYENVEAIETPDPYSVIFKLKRPQPSLLLMLAAGYSPVLPAHVPIAELRQRCVGTGPFKEKQEELNSAKRLAMVWDIQRKLEADVARPMLGWRIEYFTQWPDVKNLVAHHSLYNWGRMQEVWLDK